MKRLLLLALLGFVSLQAGDEFGGGGGGGGGLRSTLNGLVEYPNLAVAALLGIQYEEKPSLTNRFDLLQQGIKYGLENFTTSVAGDKVSMLLSLVGLDNPEGIFYYSDGLINESGLDGYISSVEQCLKAFESILFDGDGNKVFSYGYVNSRNPVVNDLAAISRSLGVRDENDEVANMYKNALYDMYDKFKQLLPKMQASKVAAEDAQRDAQLAQSDAQLARNIQQSVDRISDESKTVTVVDRAVGGIKNAANSLYSYFWSSKSNTSQPIAAPQADDAEETKADTADSQANLATSADSDAVSSEASFESDSQSAPAVVANEEYTDLEYTDL